MRCQSSAEVLNQVRKDVICGTFGSGPLELAAWFILIVQINAIEVILVDKLQDALDLVLRHPCAWEWERGAADAQEHLNSRMVLPQKF